jgi:2-polyprenyl-6-methoxyphenol hydroxylase-like FAD-dependent oxidoreductase
MKRHAEIAGAGLAGLSVGIALANKGWSVRAHERAPDLRMFGAGIWLWDNGLRSLCVLGALERTVRDARRIKQWAIIDERGGDIMRHDFSDGTNMVLPLRADLYEALIDRAQQAGVDIVTNSEVSSAAPDGTLHLANGKILKADLVVAADGAFSKIRESLLLTERISNLREGYIRLVVDAQPGDEVDVISECWNGARRFLYCPCTDKVHYVALICHVDDLRGRSDPVDREYWAEHFPAWKPIISRLSAIGRWDRGMTITNRGWSLGCVVLVGDAAHAMAPNLGQGANMTFTNAVSLAAAVSEEDDIPAALQAWERRERPLTDHVQRWSHGYGVLVSRWPDPSLPLRGPALQFLTGIPWVAQQVDRAAQHRPVGSDQLSQTYARIMSSR